MSGSIAAAVKTAKYLASGNFGYSQVSRWSGYQKGKLHEPGNLDCSSSTGVVLKMAGYPIDLTGTFYTGNIVERVLAAGYRRGPSPKGKSQAWLAKNVTAGAVLRGDGHVVVGVGDGKVLSFEYSEKGTADGKAGDQTGREGRIRDVYVRSRGWTDLLLPPADPTPTPKPSSSPAFRVLQASLESPHFGGTTDYAKLGAKMKAAGASVIGCTETLVTGKGRKAYELRAAVNGVLGGAWKRDVIRSSMAPALFWDSKKWAKKAGKRSVVFAAGDPWHGALCMPLYRGDLKKGFDFIEVHVRSEGALPKSWSDAKMTEAKKADLKAALTLVGKWTPIVLGDFSRDMDDLMTALGWVRLTPDADSYDAAGEQHLDAIYARKGDVKVVAAALIDPGSLSDHKWPTARITTN